MTKRRPKNKKPNGVNLSLGNSLANYREQQRLQFHEAKIKLNSEKINNPIHKKKANKNIESVTQETDLAEFLAKVELANTDFTAEKGDIRLLDKSAVYVVPSKIDILSSVELQKRYAERLKIPRRPKKDLWQNAEELISIENKNFLEWRMQLSELQKIDGVVLTPFERNIEVWRQLWRVVERSDIIIQIVDARNPLLFRSLDLEKYVNECEIGKQNLLLINKIDLLTCEQLNIWRKWMYDNGIEAVFWSAVDTEKSKSDGAMSKEKRTIMCDENEYGEDEEEKESASSSECEENLNAIFHGSNDESGTVISELLHENYAPVLRNPEELIAFLKKRGHCMHENGSRPLVVGMVGYPNVGKSSTINRILGQKKVSVSSTPGKTRHFQTINIDSELILCDCPGLVMPSFAFSHSEMILNGILSVNHMRDYFGPIALLQSRIPVHHFEKAYSLILPTSKEGMNKTVETQELLTAIAFMRGFMSPSGIPDCSRAARLLIKDVVSGKLKWVAAPPDVDQSCFDGLIYDDDVVEKLEKNGREENSVLIKQLLKRHLLNNAKEIGKNIDREFFSSSTPAAHIRNMRSLPLDHGQVGMVPKSKKHYNRGKKEKLRRVYADLNI